MKTRINLKSFDALSFEDIEKTNQPQSERELIAFQNRHSDVGDLSEAGEAIRESIRQKATLPLAHSRPYQPRHRGLNE